MWIIIIGLGIFILLAIIAISGVKIEYSADIIKDIVKGLRSGVHEHLNDISYELSSIQKNTDEVTKLAKLLEDISSELASIREDTYHIKNRLP